MLQSLVKAGTVDYSATIRILDATDGSPETGVVAATSGLALEYRRTLAASVALTEADLAALTTAHSDGGLKHIGNGYYRVDLPDAAVAAGAIDVLVHGTVTGMQVIGCLIQLVAIDLQDAVRLGLTALPNAAADGAGGLVISDAGGLDADAQRSDVAAILVDTGTTLDDLIDTEIGTLVTGVADIQSRIPVALVSGRIDASVGAAAANTINASALAADAVDKILDEVIEGSTTLRQMLRGFASALVSKSSGLATTTAVYRDIGDTKARITATVDADGNRTAITLDLT